MRSFLHLTSFQVYNVLLLVIFAIVVNPINDLLILYYSLYCIFHFLIIYLGIYHYRKSLYIIFFLYGLGLDLLWINEIGPHLLTFLFLLVILQFFKKYIISFNYLRIYFFLILLQILMIFIEIFLTFILFGNPMNLFFMIKLFILSLVLSYPLFIIFSKIDLIK